MLRLHKSGLRAVALLLGLMLLGQNFVNAQQNASDEDGAIRVLFVAVDKKTKQFITTLRKEDVRVLEDGTEQEVTAFEPQTEVSLSTVLMLDMSVSQERVIPSAKLVSREFVDSMVRPGRDKVGLVSFTHEAKFEQELTGDLGQMRQAIEGLEFKPPVGYVGGGMVVGTPPKRGTGQTFPGSTALWDSVSSAAEKFGDQPSNNPRRLIILITDGQDTSSRLKLNEAAEVAIRSGVVVYSIGIGDKYYGGVNETDLRKISELTGGRAFFPKDVEDLRAAFTGIAQELLRSQYLIAYSPSNKNADGKMHKIRIELVNPELRKQGVQLSYRQGRYAKKS
ncbi:MAG TPA: VWA domain-containing protein [Pyrinomonadaceae bacterium]|nr:VWA domain-containing protein [Pyrinomonadaceae bacterium]